MFFLKKRLRIHIIIICILCFIIVGCSGGKEETKSKGNQETKPPNTLDELQIKIDEVIQNTMKKDWTNSLTQTNEIQKIWNELYPELQGKGIAQENVDDFVGDLNTLSDSLIEQTLKMPKKEKKEGTSQEDSKQQQASPSGTGGQQQGGGQGQEGGQGESQQVNGALSENQTGGQGDQVGGHGDQAGNEEQQNEEINQDPKKALEEVDPTVELKQEELKIVRNAVELQKHINKFASLFSGKTPPDIYQLKYLIYDINISSKEGNWEKANTSMKNTQNLWSSMESQVEEKDKKLKLQLKQSINEIEDVLKENKNYIVGMKVKSTLELIEKLKTTFEEK